MKLAIVFDCDGVLVDSEYLADLAVAQTFARHLRSIDVQAFVHRFRGEDDRRTSGILERELGYRFPDSLHDEIVRAVDEALNAALAPVPHIQEALDDIGLIKAVASNSPFDRLKRSLSRAGLSQYFDNRIYSAEHVVNSKPAPDVYAHAALDMGLDPAQCLVVEDSVRGVTAGKAAGMTVIGFLGGRHTRPEDEAALRQAGACDVVWRAIDLPAAVRRLNMQHIEKGK